MLLARFTNQDDMVEVLAEQLSANRFRLIGRDLDSGMEFANQIFIAQPGAELATADNVIARARRAAGMAVEVAR